MSLWGAKQAFNAKTDEERTPGTPEFQSIRKYQDLVFEWIKVLGPDAATVVLEPITERAELARILDEWAVNPRREQLVAEANARIAEDERKEWVKTYSTQDVFLKLVDGVGDQTGDPAKLAKLLGNFRTHGPSIFNYTMRALQPPGFLRGGKNGDCNTLTYTFRDIATKVFNIPVVIVSSAQVGFPGRFLTPKHRTIDGKTGDVMGAYWVFENHFWVSSGGIDYDILFGEMGKVDTSTWIKSKGKEEGSELFGEKPFQYVVAETEEDEVERRYRLVSGPD